jgi:hypothetical protein
MPRLSLDIHIKDMKIKLISYLIIPFVIGLFFTQCSKQRVAPVEYEEPTDFMFDNRPEEQEFVLDTGGGSAIIGNQGTHLYMDSSIFMYPGGGDVSYPIIIKLIEVYTPKDMMLFELPTISNGQLLTTGGEIRVRAFKDNQELVLKPNKTYFCKVPSQLPDPSMGMFFGEESGDDVIWHDNASSVSSSLGVDGLELLMINTDSLATTFPFAGIGYDLVVPVMGWINCDYFADYDQQNLTTVTFVSSTDDVEGGMKKFLYFTDLLSVVQVSDAASGNVPIGAHVISICFGIHPSGAMYYHSSEFDIQAGQQVEVTMVETTEAGLLALMASF